jgi:hypothetical protein
VHSYNGCLSSSQLVKHIQPCCVAWNQGAGNRVGAHTLDCSRRLLLDHQLHFDMLAFVWGCCTRMTWSVIRGTCLLSSAHLISTQGHQTLLHIFHREVRGSQLLRCNCATTFKPMDQFFEIRQKSPACQEACSHAVSCN